MSVRSAQSITVLFTTRVFSTGVGTNADSLPTGTLYVNGVSNAATVTVANLSAGLYTAQVTLPTLAIGDEVELVIAATVSSISDKAVIWGDTKDILLDSSGDVTFNNTTLATVTTVTNQLTAAQIATGLWQDTTAGDFTVASSIGKSLYTSGALPGAAGGLFVAGTNAATTITTGLTAHIIGTVDTLTTYTGNTPQTGDVYGAVTGATVEPTSPPTSTASILNKILWLFCLGKNKRTQTSTTELVRNDADAATIGTSTKSDDGTTFTRGKYA